jgi:hypothetical protein
VKLTTEQEFEMQKMRLAIAKASHEQLSSLFIEAYEMLMKKDNAFKELLAKQWGFK